MAAAAAAQGRGSRPVPRWLAWNRQSGVTPSGCCKHGCRPHGELKSQTQGVLLTGVSANGVLPNGVWPIVGLATAITYSGAYNVHVRTAYSKMFGRFPAYSARETDSEKLSSFVDRLLQICFQHTDGYPWRRASRVWSPNHHPDMRRVRRIHLCTSHAENRIMKRCPRSDLNSVCNVS